MRAPRFGGAPFFIHQTRCTFTEPRSSAIIGAHFHSFNSSISVQVFTMEPSP